MHELAWECLFRLKVCGRRPPACFRCDDEWRNVRRGEACCSVPKYYRGCSYVGLPGDLGNLERPRFLRRLVMFKDIERLSYPCVDRGIGAAVRIKSSRISNRFLIIAQNAGACAPRRNSPKNERKTFTERSRPLAAHEFLAASRKVRTHRKCFEVAGKEKLLGIGPPTPGVG
jgi:hypothetical protein